MKIIMCVCCETCVQDKRSNVLSLINLIDELGAVSFPIAIPKLTTVVVATKTENEPDNIGGTLEGTLNGAQLFTVPFRLEFQGKNRTRLVAEMQALPLSAAGILTMILHGETGERLADWEIAIRLVGSPQVNLFTPHQGANENPPPVGAIVPETG